MSKPRKGLGEADIEAILNFDWNESSDEECEDDEAVFLDNGLKEILEKGEEIEIDLLEGITSAEHTAEECSEIPERFVVEKIDLSTLRWRKKPLDAKDVTWEKPLENIEVMKSSIDYFNSFFDNELIELIVKESNLYALQESGYELKCTKEEIRRYLGVLLYLGVIQIPNFKLAWSQELKLAAITDALPRKRFEKIKQFIHFADKSKQPKKGDANYDKLHKIRPILSMLKDKFNGIPQEEHQSIDEQVIAYKGRSAFKQYNPAKPHKWGMKMFTRASSSGVIYDFALYVGDGTCPSYGLGISSDIVLYLASSVPKFKNYKLYFDNWFTSISLLISLKEMGIFCIGTIRKNRMGNCELLSEPELKKLGRGSYDMKCEVNHGIATVRWLDNKAVQLVFTYIGNEPIATCRRWSAKDKKFVDIARPAIVTEYNKHMGGVDLSDMLMELYKINHRSTKWYMRIFYWALGTAVNNSWLLYRNHLKMLEPNAKHMPLIKFQMDIANELLNAAPPSSVQKKRGRPSENILEQEKLSSAPSSPSSLTSSSSCKRRKINCDPPNSKRYDESGHWLVWGGKGRCRLCKTGTPLSKCIKCGVHLCCNTSKNCFLSYHT